MLNSFPTPFGQYSNSYSIQQGGSVVEGLTWDQGAAGSSLTGVTALCPWARHINPSLVLVQPRKTRPFITERLLMGRKESNQTKTQYSNSYSIFCTSPEGHSFVRNCHFSGQWSWVVLEEAFHFIGPDKGSSICYSEVSCFWAAVCTLSLSDFVSFDK